MFIIIIMYMLYTYMDVYIHTVYVRVHIYT